MRKVKNYHIGKESVEDMIAADRLNPCLEITFRDRHGRHTHKLSSAHSDRIHVYREGGETFVLSVNDRLGYVGLEVFAGGEEAGDVFLQEEQVTEALGRDDLMPYTIIKRMLDLIG